jgi:hypothetical protein
VLEFDAEWEYERFRRFVLGVGEKCRTRLEARADARVG